VKEVVVVALFSRLPLPAFDHSQYANIDGDHMQILTTLYNCC